MDVPRKKDKKTPPHQHTYQSQLLIFFTSSSWVQISAVWYGNDGDIYGTTKKVK
jgi:hypothetical protein